MKCMDFIQEQYFAQEMDWILSAKSLSLARSVAAVAVASYKRLPTHGKQQLPIQITVKSITFLPAIGRPPVIDLRKWPSFPKL